MNEKDLRDCFAMFRSMKEDDPTKCYDFADAMLEARKPQEEGLVAIKRKVRTK